MKVHFLELLQKNPIAMKNLEIAFTEDGNSLVYKTLSGEVKVVDLTNNAGEDLTILEGLISDINANMATDAEVSALITPITASISSLEEKVSNSETNNIIFIGDSRTRSGYKDWYRGAATTDYKGIALDIHGCGPAITTDLTTGNTLEYRASDKSFRWTVSGDTAGEWTQITKAGLMKLESGTPGKWIRFILRSFNTLPITDQTITFSITGQMKFILNNSTSPGSISDVYGYFRNSSPYKTLGAGGAKSYEMLELLPFYLENITEPSFIIIRCGTNDLDNNIKSSETIANMEEIFNTLLLLNHKLVICGEPARWGDNATTAMTTTKFNSLKAINEFYESFCLNNKNCSYVDLFSVSVDPNYLDGRPKNGVLIDTVHDNYYGSFLFAKEITKSLEDLNCKKKSYPIRDNSNLFPNGWIIGTTGTNSTGSSGVVPTGWTVNRQSGTVTTINSIVDSTTHNSNLLKMDCSWTSSGSNQIIYAYMSSQTIINLGLVATDKVVFELDLIIENPINVSFINPSLYFSTSNYRSDIYITQVSESEHKISIPFEVGSTTTAITPAVYIQGLANTIGNVTVKFGDFVVRKVS